MKKIAVIGIQGVPAHYGGFATLMENIIGENCSPDIQYTIFCSKKDYSEQFETYKGAKLKHVPFFHANGIQSTPYDILSMLMSLNGYDTILVLGVSGCIFLPIFKLFYRKRLIINIDGLEHRRAKWGRFAKWFLRTSESMAVKYADVIIADNKGIQDYVSETYGKQAELIAYGGDHVLRQVSRQKLENVLSGYGLIPHGYSITVCRIEPENNCHVILDAFAHTENRLVFIGNWNRSVYGCSLKEKYGQCQNIQMLDPIYDLDTLYILRANAKMYCHGHSAGGTNPSLVEAMFFGIPIVAYDVVYNRATTNGKALYFKTSEDIVDIFSLSEDILKQCGMDMLTIARQEYCWSDIARKYESYYSK